MFCCIFACKYVILCWKHICIFIAWRYLISSSLNLSVPPCSVFTCISSSSLGSKIFLHQGHEYILLCAVLKSFIVSLLHIDLQTERNSFFQWYEVRTKVIIFHVDSPVFQKCLLKRHCSVTFAEIPSPTMCDLFRCSATLHWHSYLLSIFISF